MIGHALDILARVPLWKDGLDYRHGTGHGVGCYLNVHEGMSGTIFSPQFHSSVTVGSRLLQRICCLESLLPDHEVTKIGYGGCEDVMDVQCENLY